MATYWKQDLMPAINKAHVRAKIDIIGKDDIKNEAQARVALAIIEAYGNSPAGFIYFEPCTAKSTIKPPDVLLCHPDVGLLIVEVKGDTIDKIQGIQGGNLILRRGGYNQPQNPIRQAEDALYEIETEVKKIVGRRNEPLYNVMVSFPNILESDWVAAGYDRAFPSQQMIFKEIIESSQRLKQQIGSLISETSRESHKDVPLKMEHVQAIKEVLGDSAVINERRPPRSWVDEKKLGAYVDEMLSLEKYLSAEQQELSRLNVDGYPRLIRGVAGSGKTIVLANLAARFIARKLDVANDELNSQKLSLNIAVVCFNRSLVAFLNRKIRDAYKQFTLQDLPANTLTVTYFNGLLWDLSEQKILSYIPVKETDQIQRAIQYRRQIAEFAEKNPEWFQTIQFDAIFVDEGQDLAPEEYQLLLDLITTNSRTGEKTAIIFYDDAQNLYARPRPNWKQVGIDVSRGDRSRVMKECFRNPREVVELAFNVLLGSQSQQSTAVKTRTFADVNYLKQIGLVEELGDHFRVNFAERTSLKKPDIRKFQSRDQEKQWLAQEIIRLVEDEMVRPEDILILFPHSSDFEELPTLIKSKSKRNLIHGFIHPYGKSDDRDDYIFREGFLTLSTTHGAKGYHPPIVFLVGADLFEMDEKGRASFYVGATRSKMFLYVTGKDTSNSLLTEAELVNTLVDYSPISTENPIDAKTYYKIGSAHYDQKRYQEAVDSFNQSLRLNPFDHVALCHRGCAYYAQHDYAKAIEDFTQAIGLNPQDYTSYCNRGLARQAQNEIKAAIDDFETTLRLNPQYARAQSVLEQIHHSQQSANGDKGGHPPRKP